ncbi:midnolin-like isoform X1 [Dreissena polymorpha]|uniref:midnolin-like isoform X1 n=1 Tax=Dreissena polymorpha TaxID=45954 RepID=UPI0022645C1B|nr:midnolin-like isoform X1 [Dreissena polymorpha]
MNNPNHRMCWKSYKMMHVVRITIATTTGTHFQLSVSSLESVLGLKYAIARRFRIQPAKVSLLHKDKLLMTGSLLQNGIIDGSIITLVPSMQTGSHNMTTNSRVMQALENLSESQVNDFLTGRAPLLLAMKLGEHMMFVQLQLSSASCLSRRRSQGVQNHCAHSTGHSHSTSEKSNPHSAGVHAGVHGCNSGAVIDSINHLGQGVYSGTFSGTLDPSIHESAGRPKRDINTILQILNDLLVASPQFRDTSRTCSLQKPYSSTQETHCLGNYENSSIGVATNENLQGKVQTLKKLMQERKLRRQEKRGLRSPYQWPNKLQHVYQRMRSSGPLNYEASTLPRDIEVTAGNKESHSDASPAFAASTQTAIEHESVLV